MKHTKQSGFTLVELAIVLVIIGLIVGGVLVGQDLIKAAEIRSAVTQIEKYNTAATAFRTKYDGFPGDLVQARATNFFGAGAAAGAGTDGLEDGDGVLENGAVNADKQGIGGEAALFWRHLTIAQFISEGFTVADGTIAAALANDAAVSTVLPNLRLRESADIHATGIGGRNYFYVAAITAVAITTGAPTEGAALAPSEAENIDQKVDDGGYNTGVFRTYATLAAATAETQDAGAVAAAGVCINQGAASGIAGDEAYNLTVGGDAVACRARWRASF